MSKSTSDKLPSKALKTIKQPRKVLKIANINICSIRNKVHEVNNLLVTDDIHILTTSETHLDNTFDDTVVAIHGYNIYRKDRNANGGSVAVYIQNHIPVKLRDDLMLNTAEVIWLQIHLPHLKPISLGSCFRPPSANSVRAVVGGRR
jgi:exonuclease III